MPKKRKEPVTFDQWVGTVVDNHMTKRGFRQEDLTEATGIALSLIGRSIRGTRSFTVKEFEMVAGAVAKPGNENTQAASMLQEALDEYGGMTKFLGEHAPVSDPSHSVSDMERKRAEKEARLAEEGWDERSERSAANHDHENEQPEPEAP